MLGAIIGDVVGSRYEFDNTSDFDFEMFSDKNDFTDDTICTVAVAEALLKGNDYRSSFLKWCRKYPYPTGGYGGSFARWVRSADPQPYNSFGNGSAMRVSPVAWFFNSLDKVQIEAEKTALPTHNHPEGIKGAVATASAIFLARKKGKKEMLKTMRLYYSEWEEPVLGANPFYETCQGTMPIVFGIIDKAESFEEAIRYAIAVGGDSDTIGSITGSIAEAIWGIPEHIREKVMGYLPDEMKLIIDDFYDKIAQ